MIDWIICTTSRGFDAVVDGFDWLADSRIVNAIAVLLFVVFVAPPLFLIGLCFGVLDPIVSACKRNRR